MTILETDNVFAENPIYFPREFVGLGDRLVRKVPAKSFVAPRKREEKGFVKALTECYAEVCRAFPSNSEINAFCAQDMFFENSATVRHRGLWKSNESFIGVRKVSKLASAEKVRTLGSKIRFYGFCTIDLSKALCAFELIRMFRSCFLVFNDSLDLRNSESTELYYSYAFPNDKQTAVHWPNLIQHAACGITRIVRVSGTHDDREVSIDVFNF